ncbi:Prokaryotic Cytochrome C oxidase subunit IV [compost metagenome]
MLMAAIQLVIQLVYWMHMKNQSDLFSILSLAFGSIITLVAIGAAVYWVWI